MTSRSDRLERSWGLVEGLPPATPHHPDLPDTEDANPVTTDPERFRAIIWELRLHSQGRTDLPASFASLPLVSVGPIRQILVRGYNLFTRPARYRSGLLADALELMAAELLGGESHR